MLRHHAAAGRELVAPGILRRVQAAARGELPFRLGRQRLAGPCGIGRRILERDVDDGVMRAIGDRAARAFRVAPARAVGPVPPVPDIAEIDRAWRFAEDERAGLQRRRRQIGKGGGIERALRDGAIARGVDEGGELRIRHRVRIDGEGADADAAGRGFLRVMVIRSHAEHAARQRDLRR